MQSFSNEMLNELTILVGYDVWIDVIDRLLGLRVHRGGCTCIRRLAYDWSMLWTSGSAGGVLPVERRQDSSNGQGQKGRHGCQAQQQRIQHRCIGVACRDSRCKMLDQLELLSISSERYSYFLTSDATPLFPILRFIQRGIELRRAGSAISNFSFIARSLTSYRVVSMKEMAIRLRDTIGSLYFSITHADCIASLMSIVAVNS